MAARKLAASKKNYIAVETGRYEYNRVLANFKRLYCKVGRC